MRGRLFVALVPALLCLNVKAQEKKEIPEKVSGFPAKVTAKIESQANNVEEKLTRSTAKYLTRLQKQEEKIVKKLARKDSSAAAQLLESSRSKYAQLKDNLQNNKLVNGVAANYIPRLDTLTTSFAFLQQYTGGS